MNSINHITSETVYDTPISTRNKKLIGNDAVKRYNDFKASVEPNHLMNHRFTFVCSKNTMEIFLNSIPQFTIEPSIFYTNNGNLQLMLENSFFEYAEMEFFYDKIEYCILADSYPFEEESSCVVEDVNVLVEKLKEYDFLSPNVTL